MSANGEMQFKHPAGRLRPVVNPERCEGAGPCVSVCPVDVFTLRKLTADERSQLTIKARVKVFVHGGKQAFVTQADACRGCGLCVAICPENAIKLEKNTAIFAP